MAGVPDLWMTNGQKAETLGSKKPAKPLQKTIE